MSDNTESKPRCCNTTSKLHKVWRYAVMLGMCFTVLAACTQGDDNSDTNLPSIDPVTVDTEVPAPTDTASLNFYNQSCKKTIDCLYGNTCIQSQGCAYPKNNSIRRDQAQKTCDTMLNKIGANHCINSYVEFISKSGHKCNSQKGETTAVELIEQMSNWTKVNNSLHYIASQSSKQCKSISRSELLSLYPTSTNGCVDSVIQAFRMGHVLRPDPCRKELAERLRNDPNEQQALFGQDREGYRTLVQNLEQNLECLQVDKGSSSNELPTLSLRTQNHKCRLAKSECDVAEYCTGKSNTCPTDSFQPVKTTCGDIKTQCSKQDTCDGAGLCLQNHRKAGTLCDDSNACTDGDTCSAGNCQPGKALSCDDGVGCTDDSCDKQHGCKNVIKHAKCNDGVKCTNDRCDLKNDCQFVAIDANCDDNNACNGTETCDAAKDCQPGTALFCDDSVGCTDDSCDTQHGCKNVIKHANCDDGVKCTNDSCDLKNDCQHLPIDANCDDGVGCTKDSCDAKNGCQFAAIDTNCDDGVKCTNDSCDPKTDCQFAAIDANCDDSVECTNDSCHATNDCQFTAIDAICDDGVGCTDDRCDLKNGCQSVTNDANCDDKNVCNGKETCNAAIDCQAGTALSCDDNNACTNDGCDVQEGCTNDANTDSCDDGNKCTVNDTCSAGSCMAGTPLSCDDDNACTNDDCDDQAGCIYANNTDSCDDGYECTDGDTCSGGLCSGTALVCEDGPLVEDVSDGTTERYDCLDKEEYSKALTSTKKTTCGSYTWPLNQKTYYSSGVYTSGKSSLDLTFADNHNTTGHARNISISGNYAYLADDTAGLQIFDISDPNQVDLVATFKLFSGTRIRDVVVRGNYAYLAADDQGLQIIDISDPKTPIRFKACSFWSSLSQGVALSDSGDYAYVADSNNGLHIVDLSNMPHWNRYKYDMYCENETKTNLDFDDNHWSKDVHVSGKHAYVADSNAGLRIVDISDPKMPRLESTFEPMPGNYYGVHVSGNYAYVADVVNGLLVIDISNPKNPTLTGSVKTSWASGVHVMGNYAHVADGEKGLKIVDVSIPSSPKIMGEITTGYAAKGIAVKDNHAYIAASQIGLRVINFEFSCVEEVLELNICE